MDRVEHASERGRTEPVPDAPPIRVPTHGLTRYLRTQLEVSGGMMRWAVPRTLLGIVPMGVREVAVPIDDVASAAVIRRVRPLRLAIGVVCMAVPALLGFWWAVAPLGLIGLWIVLVALGPRLAVTTVSGKTHRTPVCFGHQLDADLYIACLTDGSDAARDL